MTPDFAEFERQQRERRDRHQRERQERRTALREAFDAARAAGAGKSREQIREVYVAELRARGVPMPSDLLLDAFADAIARNRTKMTVRFAVRVLTEMGKEFAELRRR